MRARGLSIVIAAVAAAGLCACPGGGPPRPAGPDPASTAGDGAPAPGGAGGAGAAAPAEAAASDQAGAVTSPAAPPPAPPAPVTREECGQLVDRLLTIGLAEQRARDPGAPQATVEQQAAIRASLLDQAAPVCASMPRTRWQCAVEAADRAAMNACAGPP
jgi:hypothetical protein